VVNHLPQSVHLPRPIITPLRVIMHTPPLAALSKDTLDDGLPTQWATNRHR
jgi:hypothetical protein